jgi:hypothetical protein
MKKNILPIILLAGGGYVVYQYFKNKDDQKNEIADKLPIEPNLEKSTEITEETGSAAMPNQENPLNTAIKMVAPLVKKQAQKFTAKVKAKRALKRKSKVIIEPLESSSTPFAPIPKKVKRVKVKRVKKVQPKRVKRTRTKKVGFTDEMILF